MPFVNADVIAKSISPDNPEIESIRAAKTAVALIRGYLSAGRSFAYETVFSHPSKIDIAEHAKKRGYDVKLVYIHLQEGLHAARVAQRVTEGGHTVPYEKIVSRVKRTMTNVAIAGKFADTFILIDNSSKDDPFELIAIKHDDNVQAKVDPLPPWAATMLFG